MFFVMLPSFCTFHHYVSWHGTDAGLKVRNHSACVFNLVILYLVGVSQSVEKTSLMCESLFVCIVLCVQTSNVCYKSILDMALGSCGKRESTDSDTTSVIFNRVCPFDGTHSLHFDSRSQRVLGHYIDQKWAQRIYGEANNGSCYIKIQFFQHEFATYARSSRIDHSC